MLFALLIGYYAVPITTAGNPHTVKGNVGPGKNPGPSNPANFANATFYLTDKPLEPMLFFPDLIDADGANKAYFSKDVGSQWNWDPANPLDDYMVVVLETVRGVNGWTGANYTTSTGDLLSNVLIQQLPDSNIELFPELTLSPGLGYVNITWTGLVDRNGNVVNYSVYRATTTAGPFQPIGISSRQISGGTVYFNDTVLTSGQYCYEIAVNYRRDNLGGIYNTTGRSDRKCVFVTAPLQILETHPRDGDIEVPLDESIWVRFNQPADTSEINIFIDPPIVYTIAWNSDYTLLTIFHDPFAFCTLYTVRIESPNLIPGPVPNPWSFTTICGALNPRIESTNPANGSLNVLVDSRIFVNFSEPMNTSSVSWSIRPDLSLTPSWEAGDTRLNLSHIDPFIECETYSIEMFGKDLDDLDLIPGPAPNPWDFTTFCSNPYIGSVNPANGTSNVAIDSSITVVFSEPMNKTTVKWTINPFIDLSASWSLDNTTLTLSHTQPFQECEIYKANITEGKDLDGLDIVPGPVPNPWTFKTFCISPFIESTDPSDDSSNIPLNKPIQVIFSEAMNTTSVSWIINPFIDLIPAWSGGDTILTLNHILSFEAERSYSIEIGGTDLDDNPLVRGPVPNPWNFTTAANSPPTITIKKPVGAEILSGGTPHLITWDMLDDFTSNERLLVYLNYTSSDGSGTIAGPLTGQTSYSWTTPMINATNVVIKSQVVDDKGAKGQDDSEPFEIDSAPPTIIDTSPSSGSIDIDLTRNIIVKFSERMNVSSVEEAIMLEPQVANLTFLWGPAFDVLAISHDDFKPDIEYTVLIRTGAKDDSNPGNPLPAEYSMSFRTSPLIPNPPTGLVVVGVTGNSITLSWHPPKNYTNGYPLNSSDIAGYNIYRSDSATGGKVMVNDYPVSATSFEDQGLKEKTTYYYWVKAVHINGRESDYSNMVSADTEVSVFPIWLLGLIIAITATSLAVLLILLVKRRKSKKETPSAEALEEKEVRTEIEKGMEEEGSIEGKRLCPKCGTALDTGESTCYMCGTKL